MLADRLKVRGTLKSWTKLWCVLKPGLLVLYKSEKQKVLKFSVVGIGSFLKKGHVRFYEQNNISHSESTCLLVKTALVEQWLACLRLNLKDCDFVV